MNSERLEQESLASAALLTEAVENKKIRNTFKQGDKLPEFLADYSVKIELPPSARLPCRVVDTLPLPL